MAQQFDCPKTETELRTLLDELYQQSRKARQEGKYPAFKGLLEIMSAETTIVNCLLDGTLLLGAGEPPYQTVRIRAPVKHEEEVEVTMVIPSRAARLDGTCRLDGSVKLNSGREVL